MMPATEPGNRHARLLVVKADGRIDHLSLNELALVPNPGDLVVGNDAATLPASLSGTHTASGRPVEVRLAAWVRLGDVSRFDAAIFGAGDYRTRTEDRPPPPPLAPGDQLRLGELAATVQHVLGHPRLVRLNFIGSTADVLTGIARHGRPIQYAHVPKPLALWDVWTAIAGRPIAFEPPSAGLALNWQILSAWRKRGVAFATLTHAAGISSTGDPALDERLPLDEVYRIPAATVSAIERSKLSGRRVIAVGTTVVRALESAAKGIGDIRAGDGIASGRIGPDTTIRLVDAVLSGVHSRGESHFELLRAFVDDDVLERISDVAEACGYRSHEFGDSVFLERAKGVERKTAVRDRESSPV
jgi:S-adenosylmethionine:tRNA ribosyltransferase-isomerase